MILDDSLTWPPKKLWPKIQSNISTFTISASKPVQGRELGWKRQQTNRGKNLYICWDWWVYREILGDHTIWQLEGFISAPRVGFAHSITVIVNIWYFDFILSHNFLGCQAQELSFMHQKNLRHSAITTAKDIKIRQPGPKLRGCQNVHELVDIL